MANPPQRTPTKPSLSDRHVPPASQPHAGHLLRDLPRPRHSAACTSRVLVSSFQRQHTWYKITHHTAFPSPLFQFQLEFTQGIAAPAVLDPPKHHHKKMSPSSILFYTATPSETPTSSSSCPSYFFFLVYPEFAGYSSAESQPFQKAQNTPEGKSRFCSSSSAHCSTPTHEEPQISTMVDALAQEKLTHTLQKDVFKTHRSSSCSGNNTEPRYLKPRHQITRVYREPPLFLPWDPAKGSGQGAALPWHGLGSEGPAGPKHKLCHAPDDPIAPFHSQH